MRLSARVDYALRATAELAAANAPRTVEQLSGAQKIPNKYLESILGELRRGGLLRSQRGPDGGYRLARPAEEISIADVIRALDGELANVRGSRPEHLDYEGAAAIALVLMVLAVGLLFVSNLIQLRAARYGAVTA